MICIGFLTPPGTKTLRILAPEHSTTRGSGEAAPGLTRSDSYEQQSVIKWPSYSGLREAVNWRIEVHKH
jgi:hypothetical protein